MTLEARHVCTLLILWCLFLPYNIWAGFEHRSSFQSFVRDAAIVNATLVSQNQYSTKSSVKYIIEYAYSLSDGGLSITELSLPQYQGERLIAEFDSSNHLRLYVTPKKTELAVIADEYANLDWVEISVRSAWLSAVMSIGAFVLLILPFKILYLYRTKRGGRRIFR